MSNYILSATLELKDKFSSTIKSATEKFKNMNKSIEKNISSSQSSLNNMASGIEQTALNMKTMVSAAAAGTVTKFVKDSYMGYVELEEQLTRNSAITRANAEEQLLLKDQVKLLGRETKFTAQEVAQAQMYQAMAGYKTNEILEVTPTLLKLSIATGEDLARTSDIITDSLSAFGLSVKDVDMYTDVLASTANNTNTTVGMMGNAFVYVGASSRALGEDFKEVGVMLGILADNGIKGEKAGTGLNAMYSRLAKPTTQMRKALKYVNLELRDETGKFKGLRKIIEESKPALEKLTAEQRDNWLVTIAGTEGLKIWTSIMNNSVESTKKAEDAVYGATGALDEFNDKMLNTDKQKIEELKSAWNGFQLQIGEGIKPIVITEITNLTEKINSLTDSIFFSTENVEKMAGAIVNLTKNASDLVSTVSGIEFLKTAFNFTKETYERVNAANDINDLIDRFNPYGKYQQSYKIPQIEDKEYFFYSPVTNRKYGSYINYGKEKNPFEFSNSMLKTEEKKVPNIEINFNGMQINTSLDIDELVETVKEKTGEALKLSLFQAKITQQ